MRQAGEPSVEEILESIKKVNARDNRSGAEDELRQREASGVRESAPAAEPEDDGGDEVLDLADSAEFVESEYELLDADELEEDEQDAPAGDQPLVTDTASTAMRESLAALAMMATPGAQPRIVRSGETSLEDLARDLLRPAIADWLEVHLPAMVERMVASEIARIVGKKG